MLDATDRTIINALQGGFPVSPHPYRETAAQLGLDEPELIRRLGRLLDDGTISRFGPMYNAEAMGGAFSLCAVAVPRDRFDVVVSQINAHDEVAHNYERNHELNVWFVLGSDDADRIGAVISEIEAETGLTVFAFPKQHEFFIGLKVEA